MPSRLSSSGRRCLGCFLFLLLVALLVVAVVSSCSDSGKLVFVGEEHFENGRKEEYIFRWELVLLDDI